MIRLLDCTLRDGGYINDWEFGHNRLIGIFERVAQTDCEFIEVGFLDDRRPFDMNRSIMPDTDSVEKIYGSAKKRAKYVVGMIDYGTCDLKYVKPCEESMLDGIRVIFKKHRMKEAMAYCAEIKKLGYKVFSQLVSIADYTDEDLKNIIELANEVKPYGLSLVDTYGLLYPDTAAEYIRKLDEGLSKDIVMGFHAHNNLQLAYANSLTFINYPTDREKIVDGTLFGMGKSAGNAPIEMLAPYLNEHFGADYKVAPMLEAIEESVKSIYENSPWGYQTRFYLAAENTCHPSYVAFIESKDNLSVGDINELLSRIEKGDKKLLYDRDYMEELYKNFLSEKYDDLKNLKKLSEELKDRDVLIVGPGKNIQLQREKVCGFINENKPYVISINYIPDNMDVDCIFITKKSRYQEMTDGLNELFKDRDIKIIATSNVGISDEAEFIFNRDPLLEKQEEITDNSFLMLLKILYRAGLRKASCAGLDGYSDTEDNYFKTSMEYNFIKTVARRLNYHIKTVLATDYADMKLNFVTYSHYLDTEDWNSGGF